ncbi:hypothetical protein FACS1894193_12710 [Bacilli bacterium]|nr:hypothetical protein FACS1894193_12710 [Bacilli bacterium]
MTQKTPKTQSKKRFQDFLLTLGIVICVLVGVGALVYPMVRNSLNDVLVERMMSVQERQQKSAREISDQMAKRQEVARQKSLEDPYSQESLNELTYDPITLPIYVKHMIGEIYLPTIQQYLPIFDNSSEQFLQVGATWLATSSPISGGTGNHSVVAGHSGIPSATLFNEVPKLKKGELIIYKVAGNYLAYKVSKISKVTADNATAIRHEADKDQTTLVTCVPIGINSHRLLVTGERVPFTPSMLKAVKAMQASKKTNHLWLWFGLSLLVILLLIYLLLAMRKLRRRRKGGTSLEV